MRIAFHINQLCLQGTEVALYDYADYCERMFGHKAVVLARNNRVSVKGGAWRNQPLALEKFRARFPVVLYDKVEQIEKILQENQADLLYAVKRGDVDGVESRRIRTAVHVVFKYNEPHGNVYAYFSRWLSEVMTEGRAPYVPPMINIPKVSGDLRAELRLPKDAVVFGRYGGVDSFNVPFAYEVIRETIANNPNAYFLFMNTNDFLNPKDTLAEKFAARFSPKNHPQVIFLPPTSSLEAKSRFINTCDAMLHARLRGETFGLAIGEFSILNKPILTFGGSGVDGFEACHLQILGDKGFVFNTADDLRRAIAEIIKNRATLASKNWDAYSAEFGPEAVMNKFKAVFLM